MPHRLNYLRPYHKLRRIRLELELSKGHPAAQGKAGFCSCRWHTVLDAEPSHCSEVGVNKGGFFPPDHGVNNSSISLFISDKIAGGVATHHSAVTLLLIIIYFFSFRGMASVHAPQLGTVRAGKGNYEAAGLLAFRQSLGLTHLKYHLLTPGVLSFHVNSSSSDPALFSCPHFYLNHYLFVQFCLWTPAARDYRLWVDPNNFF